MEQIQQLEIEYIQVQSDIKAHVTMVKTYLDQIQASKDTIEKLGKRLVELQEQYQTLTKKEE
jgi:archaellum component FlaC